MYEQVVHGQEIPAQHKDDTPYECARIAGLECLQKEIAEDSEDREPPVEGLPKGAVRWKNRDSTEGPGLP